MKTERSGDHTKIQRKQSDPLRLRKAYREGTRREDLAFLQKMQKGSGAEDCARKGTVCGCYVIVSRMKKRNRIYNNGKKEP
jgi:hypothetical protein